MSSTNTIYPKPCIYNCGIQIFWNTATSEYLEVFTKKKHICPNRVNNKTQTTTYQTTTSNTKPTYYSKKPWNTQPKLKMSNSFELLTGPIETIQKKYEVLSDIVITEHNGKVHGSQSHILTNNNNLQLIVYYEVPEGQRDEVKHKFREYIRTNLVALQRNG